ncbi:MULTISPECIES: type I polyketide synthase [Agrobacterium]|uniref:type I polyketide synthase n=1 Tax=Agrobacterium TaxID=357 RepID=UPI0023008150|nr:MULTISPECIES: type I polyketide synthase [Agrobacterium]MDA5629157.1 SDR family oxidoreductase [Agrobacterium sp. ST15.16.055]MDA6979834.1 SDR family oxidoreductase [Agrobacterium salinitolerans]
MLQNHTPTPPPLDIAIVGMASHFPDAADLYDFWSNIVNGHDAIRDVETVDPVEYWKPEDYYDPDPRAADKVYGRKAGFVPPINFDPVGFKLPPLMLQSISTAQLFALHVAKQAMADAGLLGPGADKVDRDRIGVILGGSGNGNTAFSLAVRQQIPFLRNILLNSGLSAEVAEDTVERLQGLSLEWNEDSFPGFLGNVACGRIASYFDLGGTSYMVDAACASSLAAIKAAIGELTDGSCDAVLTGGVNLENSIFSFLCFSKTPALSKSNRSRPFDKKSDGMMLGDGVGYLVLKRLSDAERDGDRIYAVIRALGASSDGRAKSIFAPRSEGQVKALKRAYAQAGLTLADIQLIEAHGTGTESGDETEIKSLIRLSEEQGIDGSHSIAIGSIKSQIGHTRCAAGAVAMMKVALGLYHKVLPPTINVEEPTEALTRPLYINTLARPWMRPPGGELRRGALSAFGFGGTNFHVILEEYEAETREEAYRLSRSAQVLAFHAPTPALLKATCLGALSQLSGEAKAAFFEAHLADGGRLAPAPSSARLAFAAATPEEAHELLAQAVPLLQSGSDKAFEHPAGIYYRPEAAPVAGRIVALFPGQGAQYVNMGAGVTLDYPELRQAVEEADAVALAAGFPPLSAVIYPQPAFSDEETLAQARELTRTANAQPAIGAVSAGYFRLLRRLGFAPDFVAGHSYGELTALWAAGVLSDADFHRASIARGRAVEMPSGFADPGAMLAAQMRQEEAGELLAAVPDIVIANDNAPEQLVFGGSTEAIARAHAWLSQRGRRSQTLPVSTAFHTSYVSHAADPYREGIAGVEFTRPRCALYSSATAEPYGDDPAQYRDALVGQLVQPVRFREMIERLYADGGYLFVEVGPKGILGKLTADILKGKPHAVVSLNPSANGEEAVQLHRALAKLVVEGVPLSAADPYARKRSPEERPARQASSFTLQGGFYLTEKNRKRREHALRHDTRVVEKFLAERTARNTPGPAVYPDPEAGPQPVQNAPALVAEPVSPHLSSSTQPSHATDRIEITMTRQSENIPKPDQMDRQIESQNLLSQLHQQFQTNQKDYIDMLGSLVSKQHSLLEKFHGHPQMESMTASLARSLQLLERNQELYHSNHERYFDNQMSLMSGEAVRSRAPVPALLPNTLEMPNPAEPLALPHHQSLAPAPQTETKPAIVSATQPSAAPVTAIVAPKPLVPTMSVPQSMPVAAQAPLLSAEDQSRIAVLEAITEERLIRELTEIVSERTGYPVDMIGDQMDLEADLGIDSIKRLEIFGAMFDRLSNGTRLLEDADKNRNDENFDIETMSNIAKMTQFFLRTVEELLAGIKGSSPAVTPAAEVVTPLAVAARTLSPEDQARIAMLEGITEERLVRELTEIVSERTGYPIDMIGDQMDLEADLGIDSIKRLEIFGAMFDRLSNGTRLLDDADKNRNDENFDIETMSNIAKMTQFFLRTIGELLADIKGVSPVTAVTETPKPAAPASASAAVGASVVTLQRLGVVTSTKLSGTGDEEDSQPKKALAEQDAFAPLAQPVIAAPVVYRHLVVRQDLSRPDRMPLALAAGRIWLIVDDGKGLSEILAARLMGQGQKVTRIQLSAPAKPAKGKRTAKQQAARTAVEGVRDYSLQDRGKAAIETLIAEIEQAEGPIGGFIHLQPATGAASLGEVFAEVGYDAAETLFTMAGVLQPRLTHAEGRSTFFAVSQYDGGLGTAGRGLFNAAGASVGGLAKSLAVEWEDVFCRWVDIDPDLTAEEAADLIIEELEDPQTALVEVGRGSEGSRMTLTGRAEPVTTQQETGLNADSVLLVSGGARGITADCVIALAERHPVRFALLGRTDIDAPLPEWAEGIEGDEALKAAAIAAMQAEGEQPTPVKVEKMLNGLRHAAQIRQTLVRIEELGGKAAYFACDIANANDVERTVVAVEETLGKVTGIIHGAGLLADKRIEKKTAEDFTAVFDTKVRGLQNLMQALRPEAIRHLVLFSSVSGFFGNAGQTDYAMANEALNKFAHRFKANYPDAFVRSIGWGPWDSGMVNDVLKKAYSERGLAIIPVETGSRFFADEFGSGEAAQILVGGDSYKVAYTVKTITASRIVERVVNLDTAPFLADHVVDGRFVLPATAAASWLVKLAEDMLPGYRFETLLGFKVIKGVALHSGETCLLEAQIEPAVATHGLAAGDRHALTISVFSGSGSERHNRYIGTVVLSREMSLRPRLGSFDLRKDDEPLGYPLYGTPQEGPLLFHGPSFRGLREVLNGGDHGLTLACKLTPVEEAMQGRFRTTSFNAYIGDVFMQAPWLWLILGSDYAGLPSAIGRVDRFATLGFGEPFFLSMTIKSLTQASLLVDIAVHDEVGQLHFRLSDVQFTISRQLRARLVGREEKVEAAE